MPGYVFHTEKIVTNHHILDIDLSVDMGLSTTRITDRMARTAAENGLTMLEEGEKVVACFREDGTQVWPRQRKRKVETPIEQFQAPALEDE